MELPLVCVITLSYNGKKLLEECLPSVLSLKYPNFRVAVIDNGSTDGTKDWIVNEYPNVTILRSEKNLGYPGFNLGLRWAFQEQGADFCLYLNNDTIIDICALMELMTVALEKEKAGFVSGKVYYQDQPLTLQTVGIQSHPILWYGLPIGQGEEDRGQYDQVAERAFLDDIFMLVFKKLYDEIGGFSENYFLHSEEIDWQARAKRAGWKFYYAPKAKIWHKASATLGSGSPRSRFFAARNRILVIAINRSVLKLLVFLFEFFFYTLRNAFGEVRHGRYREALGFLLGYGSGVLWLVTRTRGKDTPKILY